MKSASSIVARYLFVFWRNEIVDSKNAYVSILQGHLKLDEDINSRDDLPEFHLRYLDIYIYNIIYIYILYTSTNHGGLPHWDGKTVLCIPLRIQGWPGIAGFAVGVAIVMKAPNGSRGSWVACAKNNQPFLFDVYPPEILT